MTAPAATAHFGQIDEREYKRRIRAWTMYDWANSAFVTTVMAAVLPIYYSRVAGASLPSEAAATALWSMGLSVSLLIVALLSPILGTISDVMRGKKLFLGLFVGMGVIATGLLVLVSTGDWLLASILFMVGRIGMTSSTPFYDALLPHVARREDQDDVSARGYAMGYVGGGILLAANVAIIFFIPDFPGFDNAGTRLTFLSVAIWWAVFSIPILTRIPEPPAAANQQLAPGQSVVSAGFRQLRATFGDIQKYRELFKFLLAFLIYNDGIGTIIGVAAIYGAELGLGTIELILALLLVQFVGIPFALVFGRLPNKDTKYRPQFLAFVIFNIIALPVVGVAGRFLLPAEITGVAPPAYETAGGDGGEGGYLAGEPALALSGDWGEEIIPADELSGGGFVEFVNNVFGDRLSDATYATSRDDDARLDLPFNGQAVEITYHTGPDHGRWAVEMDGERLLDEEGTPVVVDGYGDTVRYGVHQTFEAETPGQHTLSLINSGGVMSVAQLEVLPPVRQNNLGAILGIVVGLNALGMGFAALLGRPLFTGLAETLDTKRSIVLALGVYAVIAVWGFFLDSMIEFWFLAWLVSVVQGGSQALSRSLYAAMSPAARSGEFFGLFGVMEKFSSMIGPLLFALAGTIFGSSRPAILSLILFFFVGIYLLGRVNVAEGRRVADAEDAALLGAAGGT